MSAPRVERLARRRGAFGLDERRWPDPARVEAALRCFLAERLPEIWPFPAAGEAAGGEARTLALLMPRGHVAMLRIERDPARPGPVSRALAERCGAMHIPHATVSTLEEGRAALRRLGVSPPATAGTPSLRSMFGGNH